MPIITLDIPTRAVDALCTRFGYKPADGTKAQFLKQLLAKWAKEQAKEHEANTAAAVASATAAQSAETGITIT